MHSASELQSYSVQPLPPLLWLFSSAHTHQNPPTLDCEKVHLVEWVGSGAPVGQEQAEANSLKDTADNTDSNQVKRSLFADDLSNELDEGSVKIRMERMDCTYTWTSGSEEDQAAEVGSPLVAQSTSSIEQSAYTVRLETRADD